MSVLKANRKPSPFEVEHHAYKVKPKPDAYEGWSQNQKDGYDRNIAKRKERYEAFVEWFIPDEQKAIIQITRDMVHEIFLANEISPQFISECDERRIHQDLALGHCENLIQELQYIITTLPVNIEKYENITNMIIQEQALIKGWRKSDNKIRKSILNREKESVKA